MLRIAFRNLFWLIDWLCWSMKKNFGGTFFEAFQFTGAGLIDQDTERDSRTSVRQAKNSTIWLNKPDLMRGSPECFLIFLRLRFQFKCRFSQQFCKRLAPLQLTDCYRMQNLSRSVRHFSRREKLHFCTDQNGRW